MNGRHDCLLYRDLHDKSDKVFPETLLSQLSFSDQRHFQVLLSADVAMN